MRKPFWGGDEIDDEEEEIEKLCGCEVEKNISKQMIDIMDQTDERHPAREIMQAQIHQGGAQYGDLPLP